MAKIEKNAFFAHTHPSLTQMKDEALSMLQNEKKI